MRLIAILILNFHITVLWSQTKEDSLMKVAESCEGKEKIEIYDQIGQIYIRNKPEEIATIADLLRDYGEKTGTPDAIGKSFYIRGRAKFETAFYKDAMAYYDSSLSVFRTTGNILYQADVVQSYANLYEETGNNAKCLEKYLESSVLYEKINNPAGLANTTNNIGITYAQLENYSDAIKYFRKAYDAQYLLGNKNGLGNTLNNIGLCLIYMGQMDSSFTTLQKALEVWESQEDFKGQAMTLNSLGTNRMRVGVFSEALHYFNRSLKISTQMNDNYGITQNTIMIAEVYKAMGNMESAQKYYLQAFKIAENIQNKRKMSWISKQLFNIYHDKKDYKTAIEYLLTHSDLRDSVMNEENSKHMLDLQSKYESERKEKEIELLNKEAEVQKLEIRNKQEEIEKQRLLTLSFIIGFVVILAFSVLLLRLYKAKKKANVLLAQQNEEIRQQKEEIEAQRDEIVTHRDVILQQKEEITDSINYASRIQRAILPDISSFALALKHTENQHSGSYFILFKPKDIVSGDFYWAALVNQYFVVTVADCTGHGVPGAFMSMLGISFLNDIVRKKEVTQANHVLNELRKSVIDALQQKGTSGEANDGMDICLIVLNTENLQLQYAGANNPLYVIKISCTNNTDTLPEITEIKPDKMPIGVHLKMVEFTNHEMQLCIGDQIYLFSDGMPDQFGGEKGKKFKHKVFRELIAENASLPMIDQQNKLEKSLKDWMNPGGRKFDQVDDITIVGLRI